MRTRWQLMREKVRCYKSTCYAAVLLASLSMIGCTITPKQPIPTVAIPEMWTEIPETATAGASIDLARWWETFEDSQLQQLIERGIANNRDMREATARIRETRASRIVTAAPLWPFMGWSGSYTRNRSSSAAVAFSFDDFLTDGTDTSGDSGGSSNRSGGNAFGFGQDQNFYQTGLDASWELDLFGRTRWAVQAANATIAEAEENRRAVLITLLAEIAQNYIELRGAQHRLAIARQNILAQQDSVEVTQARYQAGITSALDAAEAEALLANTRAQIPTLQIAVKQAIHRLGVLVGDPPQTFVTPLMQDRPIPNADLGSTIGLPSELLRRRPDIRRAERALEATTARIGVATADLFPRITLTGRLGTQGLDFSDLGKSAGLFWAAGPTVSWPIFDADRIRANIEVQDALQEQALARYEQVILISLEEVENALVSYTKEQVRQRWLEESVRANQNAVEIANERYLSGLENYLSVVLAQRALYTAQDELAQSETALAAQVIALYKALGGGWETS